MARVVGTREVYSMWIGGTLVESYWKNHGKSSAASTSEVMISVGIVTCGSYKPESMGGFVLDVPFTK